MCHPRELKPLKGAWSKFTAHLLRGEKEGKGNDSGGEGAFHAFCLQPNPFLNFGNSTIDQESKRWH